MATAKKTTATKTTAKKTTATKKPAAKKSSAKQTKNAALRSFRPAKITEPFFTFRITRQTVYWLIISVIVIGLAAWVMQLNARVQAIYDQIDQNSLTLQELSTKPVSTPEKTDTKK